MSSIYAQGHTLLTYQDFLDESQRNLTGFILEAIKRHQSSDLYKTAVIADLYDRQQNKTIMDYAKTLYSLGGRKLLDPTSSNHRIPSNFFHRFNVQRCMYSLGAGVSFISPGESGKDTTKEKLGARFDYDIQNAAYLALIHAVSFTFWNYDRVHVFPVTEFVPLWDEFDGSLKAGIRFWRLDVTRPLSVVLYEEDGYTRFASNEYDTNNLHQVEDKRPYKLQMSYVPADGYSEVIGGENYSSLPIVPLWGSKQHQSTLIGLRPSIDAYDLIQSGFANDLADCAEIYWMIENAGGMDDQDLAIFLNRLKLNHVAVVDSDAGEKSEAITQDIPYNARKELLQHLRDSMYEGFGALDVHAIAAGSTNDHIDAAYQPMDEEASDFEFQITECIRQLLQLQGIEDTPVFHRTRISNQAEQVQMIATEAQWLDQETVLRKLPNIKPEEVEEILRRMDEEEITKLMKLPPALRANAMGGGEQAPAEEQPTDEETDE